MVSFRPMPLLVAVTVVWLVWRILVWRRRGFDPVREVGVGTLFLWVLFTLWVVLFPMNIVFYDWFGTSNFVPFRSITQLITQTPTRTALENVGGNLILFVPFGVLVPLLFVRVRSLRGVVWRAGVVSLLIEAIQTITRARATDVDDVILNVTGAAIGYGAYRLLTLTRAGRRLAARIGREASHEPLALAGVPVVVSLLILVPMIVSTLLGSTIGDLEADARVRVPGGELAHRFDTGQDTFVLVTRGREVALIEYDRVLFGRSIWRGGGELRTPEDPTTAFWYLTPYNTARAELPVLVIWGRNDVGADHAVVVGNGLDERLAIPEGGFVTGLRFDPLANLGDDGILDEFQIRLE